MIAAKLALMITGELTPHDLLVGMAYCSTFGDIVISPLAVP